MQASGDSLFLVEGNEGLASGFVATLHGQKLAISNIHVFAGNANPRLTLLDRKPMQLAGAAAAVGEDIMAVGVTSGGTAMDCAEAVDN